ncbi:MAG: acyltransferase [Betaproteobacteria bacterium]
MRPTVTRLAFIDALKAIASQLVVLHHLAFYGPMSDVARELAPALFSWLSQDARIAVQIFLVIGGFLAAKALAPNGTLLTQAPLTLLKKRYFKLVIPYFAAVVLCIIFSSIARHLIEHDSIPGRPTLLQILAHLTLLQSLLDFDSLSAGVWYIAIDFQLFSLLLALLWLARTTGQGISHVPKLGVAFVAVLSLASLFYFNRSATWDNWALYFFGSYALGALTYWATLSERKPIWLFTIAMVVTAALSIDFRSRIVLALITALALGLSCHFGFLENTPKSKVLAYLGKISYSVFLAHFPVILVINALVTRLSPDSLALNAFGFIFAWAASIASGALFYRFIENRTHRWQEILINPVLRTIERFALVLRTKP